MKCIIVKCDANIPHHPDLKAWSDLFSEMRDVNGIIVLPNHFSIAAIIDDDEDAKIALNGNVIGIE